MATPRVLARPPITEALVDLRAVVSQPQEAFDAFAEELRPEFPRSDIRRGIKAELKVEHGKLMPPIAKDLGFQGIVAVNPDGTIIVQFRPDGFTFNNLRSYIGGDRLISEALRVWSRFADRMHVLTVTRIALRYINRLELPFHEGDDFGRYLTAAPGLPAGAPQKVSEFLARVVAHDESTTATVISTQRFKTPASGLPSVLIDVDAFQFGEFSTNPQDLRTILEPLRILKNQTFFSLLTDEAVKLFL
jgi:uncharacterized protein (TIGR04255 family)